MARRYAVRRDAEDLRDHHFAQAVYRTLSALPSSVDLRPHMPPVVDQGELGACTACAIGNGLREFWLREMGQWQALSALYLYWHERALEGNIPEDAGATVRDGMKVLAGPGICPAVDFPFVPADFAHTPSAVAEQDAAAFRISAYQRVATFLQMRAALATGWPVVFGFTVAASFESPAVAKTGKVPLPKRGEAVLGGHAVLAVGYDETAGTFLCRNSWGEAWGMAGYFTLPYAYWTRGLAWDMWTGR